MNTNIQSIIDKLGLNNNPKAKGTNPAEQLKNWEIDIDNLTYEELVVEMNKLRSALYDDYDVQKKKLNS